MTPSVTPARSDRSRAITVSAAPLRLSAPPAAAGPADQRADLDRASALTPRLAEILAAIVDAVLDSEAAPRATRGTVAIRMSRAPRDRRPAAVKRDAREVQP